MNVGIGTHLVSPTRSLHTVALMMNRGCEWIELNELFPYSLRRKRWLVCQGKCLAVVKSLDLPTLLRSTKAARIMESKTLTPPKIFFTRAQNHLSEIPDLCSPMLGIGFSPLALSPSEYCLQIGVLEIMEEGTNGCMWCLAQNWCQRIVAAIIKLNAYIKGGQQTGKTGSEVLSAQRMMLCVFISATLFHWSHKRKWTQDSGRDLLVGRRNFFKTRLFIYYYFFFCIQGA